jgi:hypothetical protein
VKVEFLTARNLVNIGMKLPGDVTMVDDSVGKQLVEQGFAKKVTTEKVAAAVTTKTPAAGPKE